MSPEPSLGYPIEVASLQILENIYWAFSRLAVKVHTNKMVGEDSDFDTLCKQGNQSRRPRAPPIGLRSEQRLFKKRRTVQSSNFFLRSDFSLSLLLRCCFVFCFVCRSFAEKAAKQQELSGEWRDTKRERSKRVALFLKEQILFRHRTLGRSTEFLLSY